MNGWMGQRLRIDLSHQSYEIEKLPLDYYRQWLGGRGFNAEVVYHETRQEMNPFDPANPLCFAAGALTGTFSPLSGSTVISARCPMTCTIMAPEFRGHVEAIPGYAFGTAMKYAGYDQLVVTGRAAEPMYLVIDNNRVEFRDASRLWGVGTGQTAARILQENVDPDFKVVVIGPAGENLVRFASLVNSPGAVDCGTGMGAVMGSKNLKAIAVKGTNPVRIAQPAELSHASWALHERLQQAILAVNTRGDCTPEYLKGIEKAARFQFKKISCWSCPAACGSYIYIKTGKGSGLHCRSSEIDRLYKLKPWLNTLDVSDMIMLCSVSSDLGMDIFFAGEVLSLAIEAAGKGYINQEDLGEMVLDTQELKSLVRLLDMTAHRIGVGSLLAEGCARAAERLGMPMDILSSHEGMQEVDIDPNGHSRLERDRYIADMLGNCGRALDFQEAGRTWQDVYFEFFRLVTGIEFSDEEIFEAARKSLYMERAHRSKEKSR